MECKEQEQEPEQDDEGELGGEQDDDRLLEFLPAEVESDKHRAEREKAPDNAQERVVHDGPGTGAAAAAGDLGLGGEQEDVVMRNETEGEMKRDVAVEKNATNRTGSSAFDNRGGAEDEKAAETEVEVEAEAEAEVEADGDGDGDGEGDGEGEGEGEAEVEGEAEAEVEAEGEAEAEAEAEAERVTGTGIEVEVEVAAQRVGGPGEGGTNSTTNLPLKRKGSTASDAPDGANGEVAVKRPKKRTNVWTKTSTRKSSKKSKPVKIPSGERKDERVEVNLSQRYQLEDKNGIQLSKDQKAEKVELSADKMQASSEKGYRMVRATRGISEGAWYFEIIVQDLGKTGHTRLGWSTWKGDLQAPVGFDTNSYAYRDVDGSKVHQAVRETYGTAYVEGDVIGFYINLPNGAEYAPKYELYVNKTNRTVFPVPVEKNEGPPKRVPGSEITYFKNGVCQGVAFRDIFAGEYFPAASMYTLPAPEKKCSVRFNFGPNLQFPPTEWGDRPTPRLMSQAPPPEGLGANIEEPPPVDDLKEPKKPDSTGGTASKLGSKQRMAAERGNGIAVAGLTVGSSTGGGARTKRATDPKDKGRRPGFPGKKGVLGKGPKKVVSLVPSLSLTNKNRNSISRLEVKVVAGGLSDDASGDLEADQEMEEPTQSSDEHSKWGS